MIITFIISYQRKKERKKDLVTKNLLALSAKLAIDSAKAIRTTDSESFAMPLRDGKMYRLKRLVSTELKVSTTLSKALKVRTAVALTEELLSFSKRTTYGTILCSMIESSQHLPSLTSNNKAAILDRGYRRCRRFEQMISTTSNSPDEPCVASAGAAVMSNTPFDLIPEDNGSYNFLY